MIYLDYAATTPMSKEALTVYSKVAIDHYGNTSSLHDTGTEASQLLHLCKEKLASWLNGEKDGVHFTSGGTESNYVGVQSLLQGNKQKGNHIITTKLEHSSLLNLWKRLEKEGYHITYLPSDKQGLISIDTLEQAICEDTVLVAIQHVNHEIGTIQHIEKIGRLLRDKNVLFHCDCVQSFGKIRIDVKAANISSLSISSHKVYGPKGVGALYIHPSVSWSSLFHCQSTAQSLRPGTVNTPGIASFITAAERAIEQMDKERERYEQLFDYTKQAIRELDDFIQLEGHSTHHLPNIVGLTFANVQGQYVMLQCNRYGIAISTGSACQVGQQAPSSTLLSIGKTEEEAKRFVRISFGRDTTYHHIDEFVVTMKKLYHEFSCVK
ncbi:IscS subfamily cysteine desulfurase [Metabacillus iocasae]|uniref:Cysteine desulfurase n=1 Tax=Priestia iocasae TaxID=2291674 RepID=A0ABS2QPK3_9BACI|nr:IscS subfamily cysteine desulfurase [Metabacillus iocasae]MBM7701381.1 cysteine desulfurase [Metabacillus iocasae]